MTAPAKPPSTPLSANAPGGRRAAGERRRPRSQRRALAELALIALTLAVVVGSCTSDGDWMGLSNQPFGSRLTSIPQPGDIELVSADDCEQLADRVRPAIAARAEALADMERRGDVFTAEDSAGPIRSEMTDGNSNAAGASSGRSSTEPSGNSDAGPVESGEGDASKSLDRVVGTNVQEVDVDEADFVKADADRIVTITGGVLRTIALDGTPQVDGTLALPDTQSIAEMYLLGDEALVLDSLYTATFDSSAAEGGSTGTAEAGSGQSGASASGISADADISMSPSAGTATRLTRVDLSDLASPKVIESVVVEGSLSASRAIGSTVRIVVRGDALVGNQIYGASTPRELRGVAENLEGEALLPRFSDQEGDIRPLGGCGDVMVQTKSTVGDSLPVNVTVLSVTGTLADLHPVTVQGSADTVYASTDALVVAGTGWSQAGSFTTLHRFDLSSGDKARPTGSGLVAGTPLNQFALSERSGALRVVTTVEDAAGVNTPGMSTSASLAILDAGSPSLAELSRVDGLGPGETVRSVRYLDSIAYVVTFRQTDPLYAIDLSDPRAPRNLGELKVTGFSQYMHPIDDGLLVGVGREVDPETGIDSGLKISLFDVSDPTAMTEVDRMVLPDAYSPVSEDHRAFTWDSLNGHAIVPVESACSTAVPVEPMPMPTEPMPVEPMPTEPAPTDPSTIEPSPGTVMPAEPRRTVQPEQPGCTQSSAALVISVSNNKLSRIAELSHQAGGSSIGLPTRSLIVGQNLWTVSALGVGSTEAARPGSIDLVSY